MASVTALSQCESGPCRALVQDKFRSMRHRQLTHQRHTPTAIDDAIGRGKRRTGPISNRPP